jgi:hypothetical protein
MAVSATTMLALAGPRWFVLVAIAAMVAVLAWLWRRPEAMAA